MQEKEKEIDKESQYDSEIQQQAYLSKLENVTNYLKQISLHISATMKDPNLRDYARNFMENFDKTMDEYNHEYLRVRMKRLIYFKIETLAVGREDANFIQTVEIRQRNPTEEGYFANIVFTRAQTEKFYRVHVQLWKYDGHTITTSPVLSRYQKNCMNDLLENLTDKGFVQHIQGSAVTLKTKRAVHRGPIKSSDPSNIVEFLRSCVEIYIKELTEILTKQEPCYLCLKHFIFESRWNLMMPPTIPLTFYRQRNRDQITKEPKEEKNRLFHQACVLKFLKGNSPPPQFRGFQRQRPPSN